MPQINVAKAWHLPYCLLQPLTAGQPCINKKIDCTLSKAIIEGDRAIHET